MYLATIVLFFSGAWCAFSSDFLLCDHVFVPSLTNKLLAHNVVGNEWSIICFMKIINRQWRHVTALAQFQHSFFQDSAVFARIAVVLE